MRTLGTIMAAWLLSASAASAQTRNGELGAQAVEWLQGYLRVDTINPPGNEIAGARFLAAILDEAGMPYEMVESAPGRGNIWARLEGGDEPGLLLLHHIDVVPADPNYWITDPLSGEIRDGLIYGRGALDTKSSGIAHLAAFLALHRSGAPLNRDVVFMATADEEAGGFFGAGWLVQHRPELFADIGYVINEGGGGADVDGQVQVAVEVTQKLPYWLRVTATGEPGHGSRPQAETSVTRLVAALNRLHEHDFGFRVIPAVDRYFRGLAGTVAPEWRERYADMATALRQDEVAAALLRDHPGDYGLTRNTCSITRLGASDKINVVPTEAWAELDCRLLPDQDADRFLAELGDVLGGGITVETQMGFTPAQSTAETGLFRMIEDVTRAHYPGAPAVVPSVTTGFTDSHFFRDLGITAYGYTPFAVPAADRGGVHGNNERISVANIQRGVEVMLDLLERWTVD
ncbi:MAG: M20/M25/M40 family metallo-hydrolase [Acidobacteria bacterium]|nr:M20/M25/M40 family metallo-hydrolase [Acidobacteriota bacterium]